MRKHISVLALGLALSLGASGVVVAQSTDSGARQGEQRGEPGGPGGGQRGRGGPEATLLRGITLSADQQSRLDALRQTERSRMEAERGARGANGTNGANGANGQARGERQRPDSATMAQMRARFQQDRERRVSAIRGFLTADQRRTFDANLTELRQREAQRDSVRRAGGDAGERHGDHGDRGQGGPENR